MTLTRRASERFAEHRTHRFSKCSPSLVRRVTLVVTLMLLTDSSAIFAADAVTDPSAALSPQALTSSLPWLIGATVLSVVPAVLLMSTCFVRFSVVLSLLRQALGATQVVSNQILMALSLFLTGSVMAPVWQESYESGWKPYAQAAKSNTAALESAVTNVLAPLRRFMSRQVEAAGNSDGVWMMLDLQRQHAQQTDLPEPRNYDDVPITVLLPAFLLSELKVGFQIGFQIFLPFLVIDFVIASVLTALGLTTLTPSMVSLPFKLLLFVLIDGWFLTVGMLMSSISMTG